MREKATIYTDRLISYMNGYFINGENPSRIDTSIPPWINLSKHSFDFIQSVNERVRIESFAKLLETLIQPLTRKEQELARFQYNMLLPRVNTVLNEDSKLSSKPQPLQSIINQTVQALLQNKEFYKGCKFAIAVMLLYNLG